jgi:hypothetical protein
MLVSFRMALRVVGFRSRERSILGMVHDVGG